MRTTVGIIGAGPAGLLLSRLLHQAGIKCVVLESRSREHVEQRQRAGILEQGTIDVLRACGAGERMDSEGLVHTGIELLFKGERHRIDLSDNTQGRTVMVYAQTEICKDLVRLQLENGGPLLFDAEVQAIRNVETAPVCDFVHDGRKQTLECDYMVGCDGFWGICRSLIPEELAKTYSKTYPFSWLGILARAPPSSDELIYARHDHGFALLSMRSPTVSRCYLQVPNDTIATNWSDESIWDELDLRTQTNDGFRVSRGDIISKSVTPMRSYVHSPMQYGRLYLAGDAAHIVPPTGAKGLNLAVADVVTLSNALQREIINGERDLLAEYSDTCLKRVWQAERFSFDMTNMLHSYPDSTPFDNELARVKLRTVVENVSARTELAAYYTGAF